MALVLITHNMGVVRRDGAARGGDVCRPGRWRSSAADGLFAAPQHPYTEALLAALPERSDGRAPAGHASPAWCRALYDRPARLPVRAALRLRAPSIRAPCGPTLRAWQGGQVRCHYPLGDPRARQRASRDGRRPPRRRESARAMTRRSSSKRRDLRRSTRSAAACSAQPAQLQAVGGVSFALEAGRDAGGGRRIGLRQVDAGAHGGADREADRGHADAGRHRRGRHADAARRSARCARPCSWCSRTRTARSTRARRSAPMLEAPLAINTDARPRPSAPSAARAMLAQVGLRPEHADRYPHMFSGGQRQRIAIARALMLQPEAAWWPTSRCRRSTCRSRRRCSTCWPTCSTNSGWPTSSSRTTSAVVRHIAHDVLVMYLGQRWSRAPRRASSRGRCIPYTQALLASTPGVGAAQRQRIVLKGELPSPLNPPPRLRVLHAAARMPSSAAAPSGRCRARSTSGWWPATSPKNSSNRRFPRPAPLSWQRRSPRLCRRPRHDPTSE